MKKKRYLECKSHSLIESVSLSTTAGIRHWNPTVSPTQRRHNKRPGWRRWHSCSHIVNSLVDSTHCDCVPSEREARQRKSNHAEETICTSPTNEYESTENKMRNWTSCAILCWRHISNTHPMNWTCIRCMPGTAPGSLRFHVWYLSLLSFQRPSDSVRSRSLDGFNKQ